MESITSLVVLAILIVPALFMALNKILNNVFFTGVDALSDEQDEIIDAQGDQIDARETAPVFDGMDTVEIPAPDNQVIAYESLPEAEY